MSKEETDPFAWIRAAGLSPRSSSDRCTKYLLSDGTEVEVKHPGGWDRRHHDVRDSLASRGFPVSNEEARIQALEAQLSWYKDQISRVIDSQKAMAETLASIFIKDDPKCIRVWEWRDAPKQFRALSTNGGDEDWVALLPPGVDQPGWADSGGNFGCCDVSGYVLDNGCTVLIGAHA